MADYTDELAQQIYDCICDGMSVEATAKHVGISDRTIYRWANGQGAPESFCQGYARAMAIRADRMAEEMLEIADRKGNDIKTDAAGNHVFDDAGNPVIDHDNIQRAKVQIDTRKWIMGQWNSPRYGDKRQVELTGKDGKPIETRNVDLSPEEIREKLAALGLPTELYEK